MLDGQKSQGQQNLTLTAVVIALDAPREMSVASGSHVPILETPTSFAFPFPKPYDIQLQLMRTVFNAIERNQIAIVSSVLSLPLTASSVLIHDVRSSHPQAPGNRLVYSLRL